MGELALTWLTAELRAHATVSAPFVLNWQTSIKVRADNENDKTDVTWKIYKSIKEHLASNPCNLKGRKVYVTVEASPEQRSRNAISTKAQRALEEFIPKEFEGQYVPDYVACLLYLKLPAPSVQHIQIGFLNKRSQTWQWQADAINQSLPLVQTSALSERWSSILDS